MTNKIDKFVVQDLDNHSFNNSSNSTKHPKFINLFINNKSSHFEQFIILIRMIQVDINDIEINNIVNASFR